MLTATVIKSPRTQFRYESDLVSVVRNALPRIAFRHTSDPAIEIFSEVPAVHGVPDLAGIRFNQANIQARILNGVQPLSTDTEVRVVMALSGVSTMQDLAGNAGLSLSYLRRNVIPLLTDLGWIESDGLGFIRRCNGARWVGKRVVTVEAKLRDWRSALSQARRQRLSADAAYIALDSRAAHMMSTHLPKITTEGIGVISVDAETERIAVLARPPRLSSLQRELGRNLLAERCLDMLNRGTREGQIYPVFGWTLPQPI